MPDVRQLRQTHLAISMPHSRTSTPPPILFDCWVTHFARLGRGAPFSGRSRAYWDGREIGRVPYLAIARSFADPSVVLLHCGRSWRVLGSMDYPSVRLAKAGAERSYPGAHALWVATALTIAKARHHRRAYWQGAVCSFCGAFPPQTKRLVQKGRVAICDACIRECSLAISDPSTT
jgi:hypothetical protein